MLLRVGDHGQKVQDVKVVMVVAVVVMMMMMMIMLQKACQV